MPIRLGYRPYYAGADGRILLEHDTQLALVERGLARIPGKLNHASAPDRGLA